MTTVAIRHVGVPPCNKQTLAKCEKRSENMVLCIVVGCGVKSNNQEGYGMFRIPSVIKNQGDSFEQLTQERRDRWISAISRDDIAYKNVLSNERVCGKHFVSGRPAMAWDKFHEDWIPTQHLGKKNYTPNNTSIAKEKAERVKVRGQVREQLQREAREKEEQERLLRETEEQERLSREKEEEERLFNEQEIEAKRLKLDEGEYLRNMHFTHVDDGEMPTTCDAETQTEEFDYMFVRNEYQAPGEHFFKSEEKVRFYTGLPSYDILLILLEHIEPHVSRTCQSLSRFQEFVMVLMKLRLNVPFQDLGYRFMVSRSTVSRIFYHWMVVMDIRLKHLIYWPTREELWETMPSCFKYSFGNQVTVVIDCFEVFMEKPSNLLARAQTFSNYKHHNTIKILIGITPQGHISFVSEAWGGRTSDKYLTENSGFLSHLLPGDMVMADRGFTVTESVGLHHAKLVIPAFTKGKSQLDPVDVERTRGIAHVRIHVERVIGLLRRKYTILQSTLPSDFLVCNRDGPPEAQVPMIDRIIRVCSALVNSCPPIIPFE